MKNPNSILSKKRPDLCKKWDYEKNFPLTPDDITYGSHIDAHWRCKKGHLFQEWIRNMFRKNIKKLCPICMKNDSLLTSSLANKRPDLLKEWDWAINKEDPSEILFKSRKIVSWTCKNGHKWKCALYIRSRGGGCPYCANKRVCADNNLLFKFPEIAKEWNYKKNSIGPDMVVYSSEKKYWWICKLGHEWIASINQRTQSTQTRCPHCSKKVKLKDGTCFDSMPEAYLYLKLKSRKFRIEINKKYGLRGYRCDFYLPEFKTYIEVTSYYKSSRGYVKKFWPFYYKKILKKREYVEKVLRENFRFIQFQLNNYQRKFIRKYMV